MTSPFVHTSVMLREALAYLGVRRGGSYIDLTTGLGGHSEAIAQAIGPEGRLLCVDADGDALKFAQSRLSAPGSGLSFHCGNFGSIDEIAATYGFSAVDGILMDLGVSSMQLQRAERGFAFALEGPLDMRLDQAGGGITAGEIVNSWDERELADIFFQYGEERLSRRIAAAIIRARPLRTTWDLASTIEQAVGRAGGRTSIHPATRCFQALRIVVNGELDTLERALPRACGLLDAGNPERAGGRLVVIAFHSLEDRIVKQYFRRESSGCLCPASMPICRCRHTPSLRELTHRAIRPAEDEVAANPRSRSAVLRAVERIEVAHGRD